MGKDIVLEVQDAHIGLSSFLKMLGEDAPTKVNLTAFLEYLKKEGKEDITVDIGEIYRLLKGMNSKEVNDGKVDK